MQTIDPELIIDRTHVAVTQEILEEDQIIDVYLHNSAGNVAVSGGIFGSQVIETVAWTDSDFSYIQNFYSDLNNRLDINFLFTSNQSTADISIFLDTEIDIGSEDGVTLGLAVSNYNNSNGYYWELFLNRPGFGDDTNYFRYALIHEICHSLGLEHPFEDGDGDVVDGITDPWNSLYPEDTVMAYRNPSSGSWPTALTENDWAALGKLWGTDISDTGSISKQQELSASTNVGSLVQRWLLQLSGSTTGSKDLAGHGYTFSVQASSWNDSSLPVNRVSQANINGDLLQAKQLTFDSLQLPSAQPFDKAGSVLNGSDASDTVRGLAGWDVLYAQGGDDLIHGGNGRDIISGGSGADELHGDFGRNTYLDQADGSIDLIAIKSDQHLVNWWFGTAGNNADGYKADVIERLDAHDQIKIIGAATEDLTFRQASIHGLSGVGIFADGAIEAIYTGGDLSAQQLQSMTTGDSSDAAMNNQIWSYNFGNEAPQVI